MKKIIPLLALALSCPPLTAQVDYDGNHPWSQTTSVAPDNAVPGWFYNLGITGMRVQLDPAAPRTLVVKHVFASTPAAAAGIQVNDVITGVEGQPFTADHQDGYGVAVFGAQGPIGEFGIALDDAQGVDGLLGVTLTRGGSTLNVTLNVGQVYGSFSPTFPSNCPKSALILSQLLTYLRTTQQINGAWGGEGGHENHIFAGLALLSDGSPASMTAAGNLATYYNNQTNVPIAADGLNHWKYLAAAIYLSEYYHKTNQAWVLTKLNTLYGYLLASQYTHVSQIVPGAFGSDPTVNGFGGWGHNPGFEGYGPICMTTGQGALALALMKRVGVNVDRARLDAAYDFLARGTGANSYVWYGDGPGGGPNDWADPGRTGAAAIANWMSPYNEPVYATRALNHARFMGAHPQSFPDTHGSPTIGMAYAAMGTQFDPVSFRQLLDDNRWWFSLAQTPEGNFYYQPNRDNAGYGTNPRFVASSVTAMILSLPQRNLLVSEREWVSEQVGSSPVKIFILAGQSNMLGQGDISPVTTPGTLEHTFANDPAGIYQFLKDGGGNWVVRDDVWIRDQDPSIGGLTIGYGADTGKVGPELGFGHFIGDLNEQQVLIVKAAWGGKSLAVDFRPPSSGGTTGFYYNEILRLVNEATTNLGTYFTDYNGGGYEIVGFGWHQGWNDRVTPSYATEYQTNMANFIRDMRSALGKPNLPFVIATTGMDGGDTYSQVEQAQLAMANTTTYPDFADDVKVIDTRSTYEDLDFWQPADLSPADEGYHWNRNAKTYTNIGLAMGDAMSVLAPGRSPFRPRAVGAPSGVSLSWQNGTEIPTSVRILRNGVEIAAAAPTTPSSYLDATALPGAHTYELQFTMPVTPSDPLTASFNGGISGLTITPVPGGLTLNWTNNMGYTAIEVRRDGIVLGAPLSGTATSYTDTAPPGTGTITYTVAPTTGTSTPASALINLDLACEVGVLDPYLANDGINPATGLPWAEGDTYRLIFVTSGTTTCTSTDIATYNTYVQGLANAAGLGTSTLGPVTWKVVGSTATVDARDNTGTNPGVNGVGEPILRMDGTFVIANSYADLWNGITNTVGDVNYLGVHLDENGVERIDERVRTGTGGDGTAPGDGRVLGGSTEAPPRVQTGRNHTPLFYGSYGPTGWMQDWSEDAASVGRVYAMSEPLTIVNLADNGAPTLVSITDDKPGGSVTVPGTVTYTVTFSEPMNATSVGVGDFENDPSLTTDVTINSAVPTANPAAFLVTVATTEAGSLRLRIKAGAVLTDLAGNQLDTSSALPDDTTIVVNPEPALVCQVGVLNLGANGGINPATGLPWAAGDKYRLIFVTSGTTTCNSTDIATYNTFVQGLANTAGLGTSALGPVTWKVVGSTATVAARDNTNTNPTLDGGGEPIFRMDGTFAVANNYADLWNGIGFTHETGQNYLSVHLDENGVERIDERVRTGSGGSGTAAGDGRVLGGSAEATPRVQTGRNYAPDFYGGYGATGWMADWSEEATSAGRVYAMSGILTIVSTTPPDPYQIWLGEFTFAPGADTTPTGDPDGDGMSNQQEFAFSLNPTLGSSVNPIVTPLNPATGNFQYTRRATPETTGLTYTVLTSTTLTGWAAVGATETGFTTAGNIQTVTVNVTAPPVGGKMFVRVEATPTP